MKAVKTTILFILLPLICCISAVNAANNSPVGFDDFVKNKIVHQGFYSFYHDEKTGQVYLEIEHFNQEFLFQSSMPHGIGSNDIGLDRGQLGDTRLVQFERVGNKVFLRQLNTDFRANTENPFEQNAIKEAFATSIIWGFSVESEHEGKVIINYTPFLLSDIHQIADRLKKSKQGNFKVDASRSGLYSKRTKAFEKNTEFEATVTFSGADAGEYLRSVTPENTSVSVNLHHSLIQLPDNNYQSREFHPYSGFWSLDHADYATAIDEPLIKRVIPRHRLHKKPDNNTSGLSEPIEPIVYYLDAGVPEPVRSALLDGASWWNEAFEAIGYRNAFQVKILPVDADPMDVRYNVIQWVHRATRGWSYGSSVVDPRTGEIIKGHVTLGSLRVRQDYLIALGLTSPFKTENTDTSAMKEMALARIRQLSAHEVGHTLGISHNFSASVNNRASVMDYPHPLIEINNDTIDLSNAYAKGIGEWDKYVIAYGYSEIATKDEKSVLAKLVKSTQDKGLLYISDPDARPQSGANNTGHLWDNGNNAAQELTRVLQVREKALADFGLNSINFGEPLSEIEQVLVPIYNFHRYQVEATAKLIGGVDYGYELRTSETPMGVKPVSAALQNEALQALISSLSTQVLTLPNHIIELIPPKAYGYSRNRESFTSQTGLTFDPVTAAQSSAKNTLELLLNAKRLARVQQQSAMYGEINSLDKMLSTLVSATIYQAPQQGLALLVQQRVNQQLVEELLQLWHQADVVPEVRAEVWLALDRLSDWLLKNRKNKKYKGLEAHFTLLNQQIKFSLQEGKPVIPENKLSLPPGSPIGN